MQSLVEVERRELGGLVDRVSLGLEVVMLVEVELPGVRVLHDPDTFHSKGQSVDREPDILYAAY